MIHGSETPLGITARVVEPEITAILLQAGADPNIVSTIRTPLAWACMTFHYKPGNLDIVKQLLAAGGKVNPREGLGGIGHTPLHWAAERGYLEIAVELLKAGANPRLKEKYRGNTPLDLATKNNHKAVADLLSGA